MKRLLSAMKTDVMIQFRNKLYAIGIAVGIILAIALSQLVNPGGLPAAIPTVMLLVIGGSTLFYVGAIILFERDEGTLNALMVSPLRSSEYLWSKIITLSALATLESVVTIGGTIALMQLAGEVSVPNVLILLSGILGIAVMYTLVGIILIVRYRSITDFLIPMAGVAVILQFPFLYFLNLIEHPFFLLIPTSAPTMLIKGAFTDLHAWEWAYVMLYTLAAIAAFSVWAHRAFKKHII